MVNFFSQLQWRPQIGDPDFMGWFTVCAYAACTLMAAAAAVRGENRPVPGSGMRTRTVWTLVALLMGFLCVNKQLDLQTLFTDIGRLAARNEGWYGHRRGVQEIFVFCLLGGAGGLAVWLALRFKAFWADHTLLLSGLMVTLTFIVVRAVTFHHIDQFLGTHLESMRMNWILELGGISLVTAAAALELSSVRK